MITLVEKLTLSFIFGVMLGLSGGALFLALSNENYIKSIEFLVFTVFFGYMFIDNLRCETV